MKNILYLLIVFVFAISCKTKNSDQTDTEGFMVCNLKVIGLADSTVADSIWKINFIDGIESIYIKPADSILSIKAERSKITRSELFDMVEEYGVQIIDAD